jgi:carboxylesterase
VAGVAGVAGDARVAPMTAGIPSPVILPGAEPFLFRRGRTGCLLLHGFTAAPQEVLRLGAHLANHGYTALGPRLAGHGTALGDLARTRWPDWLASAQDGYDLLRGACDRIVLLGVSMGGLLAVLLAVDQPPAGLVLMSTPITLLQSPLRRWLKPLSGIVPFVRKGPPDWFDQSAGAERIAYPAYSTRAAAEVQDLLPRARAALAQVAVPTLVVHSRDDAFVLPANAELLLAELGAKDKRLLMIEGSNHLVTLDAARQQVFEAAHAFVRRVAGPPR